MAEIGLDTGSAYDAPGGVRPGGRPWPGGDGPPPGPVACTPPALVAVRRGGSDTGEGTAGVTAGPPRAAWTS